jgi:hypothetical protein
MLVGRWIAVGVQFLQIHMVDALGTWATDLLVVESRLALD